MTEVPYSGESEALVEEGIEAAENGNIRLALDLFNQLKPTETSPLVTSYLAYCLACEQKAFRKALDLANDALQADRLHPLIYLNVGRVFLEAGYKKKAMQTFRKGIRCQRHPLLLRKIESLSNRRPMPFSFLPRSNPLNIIVGKILSKVF